MCQFITWFYQHLNSTHKKIGGFYHSYDTGLSHNGNTEVNNLPMLQILLPLFLRIRKYALNNKCYLRHKCCYKDINFITDRSCCCLTWTLDFVNWHSTSLKRNAICLFTSWWTMHTVILMTTHYDSFDVVNWKNICSFQHFALTAFFLFCLKIYCYSYSVLPGNLSFVTIPDFNALFPFSDTTMILKLLHRCLKWNAHTS